MTPEQNRGNPCERSELCANCTWDATELTELVAHQGKLRLVQYMSVQDADWSAEELMGDRCISKESDCLRLVAYGSHARCTSALASASDQLDALTTTISSWAHSVGSRNVLSECINVGKDNVHDAAGCCSCQGSINMTINKHSSCTATQRALLQRVECNWDNSQPCFCVRCS